MKTLFTILTLFSALSLYAIEVCNNAIDDDGDGLIDMQDTADCLCTWTNTTEIPSLIPNSDFENMNCCPSGFSDLNCADGWIQATAATTDYYNTCGNFSFMNSSLEWTDDPRPYPSGNGAVGFLDRPAWKEYIGSCLTSDLKKDSSYTLDLFIYTSHFSDSFPAVFGLPGSMTICNSTGLDLTIYGTTSCANLPIGGSNKDCPTDMSSNWFSMGSVHIDYVASTWQSVSLTFIPTVDVKAIMIGPGCGTSSITDCVTPYPGYYSNYFYADGIILAKTEAFGIASIDSVGRYCDSNIVLHAHLNDTVLSPSYQWYKDSIAIPGATDSIYQVPPGEFGLFQVLISDGTNCGLSSMFEVLPDSVEIGVSQANLSCYLSGDGEIYISPLGGTPPYTYSLNGVSVPDDTVSGLFVGSYVVGLTDADGCDAVQMSTITEPQQLDVNLPSAYCQEQGIQTINPLVSGGTPTYTYIWNGDTLPSPFHFNLTQDTVIDIQVIDANGCVSSMDSMYIFYVPFLSMTADTLEGCPPLNVEFNVLLDGQVSDVYANASWSFGDASNANIVGTIQHHYSSVGAFTVDLSVLLNNGCSTSTQIVDYIDVYEYPTADFMIDPEEGTSVNPIIHFIDQSINAVSYQWQTLDQIFSSNKNTQYDYSDTIPATYNICLYVLSQKGCADSICKEFVIQDNLIFYIPTAFTPNGDNTNDQFGIKYYGRNIEQFELLIFDRWGEIVATIQNQDLAWDGTYLGKDCEQAVYTWTLNVKYLGQKPQQYNGKVVLVR